jgi:CheY-like chemotaxis protein
MPDTPLACPYCSRALDWVPQRWFGRGSFACQQCGEFPDLASAPGAERTTAEQPPAAIRSAATYLDDRPRVLLVDDSAEYRDLYALMLEHTATVITASRGEDALTIARTQPLDAIVLDVMMPGMDGWRTCECLKASPLTSGIPVIMLTSLDGLDVPERAERVGAAAVLIKPCPIERLALAIAGAVQRRFGGSRRWPRKSVKTMLAAEVDKRPATILNMSYSGLCVRVDGVSHSLPTAFVLSVPSASLAMRADAVWTTGVDHQWLCGAEIAHASDSWRRLVDAVA